MIYICIPTHNEQQTVGVVLWKLRQVLTEFPRDYQLLVADDASTDKTPDVLEPYTRVLPLTVVRSDRRLGYGASLEMLLREAVRRSEYPKRDIVVTLQADFSEEPDDLVPLIKRLEAGADIAVGNKVSKEPMPRLRRFSRGLAGFFTRRHAWPESVETPFDGYRAYRLHAVKRAVQESEGRRLIRFDGWAANAELLRQVLPHARRVDAIDVVDRTDRLQRPRRERPLAAAFAVRSMDRGTEPADLVSVEELDGLAASASRSRERVRLEPRPAANGRATRSRSARGSGARSNGSAGGSSREKGGRTRDRTRDRDRSREGGRESGEPRQRRRGRRQDADAAPGAAVEDTTNSAAPAAQAADVAGTGTEEPKPKKRRRRRRRGSGSAATKNEAAAEAATEAAGSEATESGASEADEAGADAAGEPGTGERKRRRRGGRRGGRRRRRSSGAESSAESGADGADAADAAETGADSGRSDGGDT